MGEEEWKNREDKRAGRKERGRGREETRKVATAMITSPRLGEPPRSRDTNFALSFRELTPDRKYKNTWTAARLFLAKSETPDPVAVRATVLTARNFAAKQANENARVLIGGRPQYKC